MNPQPRSFPGALLLTLLGGASLGALAVALTTPKTGKQVRNLFKAATGRSRETAASRELPELDDLAEDGPVRMLFV